jgi:hypothetical protein
MFKTSALSCLLIFSVYSAAGQEITEQLTVHEEQVIFDLASEKLSDADILQSLNEVVDQLDSEILAIEAKVQPPANKMNITTEDKNLSDSVNNAIGDEFDNSFLLTDEGNLDNKVYEDDMDLIDGFDDMVFDDSFLINELGDEQIDTAFSNTNTNTNTNEEISSPTAVKVLSNNLTVTFEDSFPQSKSMSSQGVGIGGDDEQTINSLDNSDLMDYMEESDVWTEDMIDDIEIYD